MIKKVAVSNPDPKPAPESTEQPKPEAPKTVEEVGGPKGLDPTRFGDWSVNGRCIDF
jgi:hypothetical protein